MSLAVAASLRADDVALFASDIHLGEHDRDTAEWFFESLRREAARATHVFLLGDLFEAWIGDDQDDAIADRAVATFAAIGAHRKLFLMRGNRDFLLDVPGTGAPSFAERACATMLADPTLIDLFGERVLLMHGDALCIDDLPYQAFRRQARDAEWQAQFLSQPMARRLMVARQLRGQSEREKIDKAAHLMDVNDGEVIRMLHETDAHAIVHGHTHRPDDHTVAMTDNQGRAVNAIRWVLPDWEHSEQRGGFLQVSRAGWRRIAG